MIVFDINDKSEYYKIMKPYTMLAPIMLLTGSLKHVCAQEHQHEIDSVNHVVLYSKLTKLFWTARIWATANP